MSDKKMNCRQVQALLPFYLQGKVSPEILALIEEHLDECEVCKELYIKAFEEYNNFPCEEIRAPLNSFKSDTSDNEQFKTESYDNFRKNLSAYFDSELDDTEQFKIKKLTISNPLARRDLENMYKFKQLLHKSFEKTKNSFKQDFSKSTMKKIGKHESFYSDKLFKYTVIMFFIALALTIGLYFSV